MTVCGNCGTAQGPFDKAYGGPAVCRNSKGQVHKDDNCNCRVTLCVKRRTKLDHERYQDERS